MSETQTQTQQQSPGGAASPPPPGTPKKDDDDKEEKSEEKSAEPGLFDNVLGEMADMGLIDDPKDKEAAKADNEDKEDEDSEPGRMSVLFERMKNQREYSIFNPRSKYPFIFTLEPYVVFALGIIISVIIIIRSLANGDPMSKDLSIVWIILSLYIILTTGAGTYFSERVPDAAEPETAPPSSSGF